MRGLQERARLGPLVFSIFVDSGMGEVTAEGAIFSKTQGSFVQSGVEVKRKNISVRVCIDIDRGRFLSPNPQYPRFDKCE